MADMITLVDGVFLMKFQRMVIQDGLTPVVTFLTHLGDKGYIWIACILLMLCFRKTRRAGIAAAAALAISFAFNNLLLKNLIARTRPYEVFEGVRLLIERQSDYSFPSGHAASSFATAVVMFRMLPKKYGVPALTLAVMIALSRLYVGVHFPGDVAAGALSGTVIALLVSEWFKRRDGSGTGAGARKYGEHRK